MHGQRVAGEHGIHEPESNQLAEMLDAPRVNDDRPGDDGHATTTLLDLSNHVGDAPDRAFDAAL